MENKILLTSRSWNVLSEAHEIYLTSRSESETWGEH